MGTVLNSQKKMFQILYGSTAAGLYDQAAKLNAQARTLYLQSSDTYYKANDAAAYDDWVRARAHWDYFYHRSEELGDTAAITVDACKAKATAMKAEDDRLSKVDNSEIR